jgi:hypothetical protein
MLTYNAQQVWNDEDVQPAAPDLTDLHRAYMSSIRQHQQLLKELCKTLSKLGVAVDKAPLDLHERNALSAGLGLHVDEALGIIAGIDTALSFSAPTRPAIAH